MRNVHVNNFEKDTGPTNILPPEDLIELIVNETNLNAEQKQRAAGRQDQNWTPVNGTDIRAYFGIRILQGTKTLPSERHFWSRNKYLHVKKVSDTMTRNRYLKINKYLHFNDATTAVPRDHEGHDKLHQICPLIERLTETFSAEYKPNKENAIDEGLIKFKGRLGFKQYMPLKQAKHGIKVWLRADSVSHFVCQFDVYTGRPNRGQEHGLGERVVKELSRDLANGNYHLYFDNFFTCFILMKDHLDDNIYATATTCANRKDFLLPLKEAKLNHGESISMQRNGVTACSWQDKKKVNFLTTNCQPTGDDTVLRREKDGTQEVLNAPPCVVAYNKFMGGVDYADQKRNEYRIPVKSRSWYRYLAFFLFETAIVNAYILRQLSPNHGGITQLDFCLELLDKLIGHYSSRKRKRATTDIEVLDGKSHFPIRVTLNRCVYCASRNQRHCSTWGCVLCDVTLCVSCFEPFHTR